MGGHSSRHKWDPPAEPIAMGNQEEPVDYHLVACPIKINMQSECTGCCGKTNFVMDSDEMYDLLHQQYARGFRLLHFARVPGDLHMKFLGDMKATFHAFYRVNPDLGDALEKDLTWRLSIERSCVRSTQMLRGCCIGHLDRVTNTDPLEDCIHGSTRQGQRLVAVSVAGSSQGATCLDECSGLTPSSGVDLFFEIPSPGPCERYVYKTVQIPINVEFCQNGSLFFPGIAHDWMGTFIQHLQGGWCLIDIFIDVPMSEQLRVPIRQRRQIYCSPMRTSAYWFFERPASEDGFPRYEGTIVEQDVDVRQPNSGEGSRASPNWLPLVRDMGGRGWELACVVECHAVKAQGLSKVTIKSLLFFQRPREPQ